jgi:hypothetical protein
LEAPRCSGWAHADAEATVRDLERWRRVLRLRPYSPIEREDKADGEGFLAGVIAVIWMLIGLGLVAAGFRSLM